MGRLGKFALFTHEGKTLRAYTLQGKSIKNRFGSYSKNFITEEKTDKMVGLEKKKIKIHYTKTVEGYQLKVQWHFKCKEGRSDYSIGTSFKYTTDIKNLNLEQMLHDADIMAWANIGKICYELEWEYRSSVILEHFIPIGKSALDEIVTLHRQKKDNLNEYSKLVKNFDINASYDTNKKLAKKQKRKMMSREDFYTLKKIVKHEKLTSVEKKKKNRVTAQNSDFITLYKLVGSKYEKEQGKK